MIFLTLLAYYGHTLPARFLNFNKHSTLLAYSGLLDLVLGTPEYVTHKYVLYLGIATCQL